MNCFVRGILTTLALALLFFGIASIYFWKNIRPEGYPFLRSFDHEDGREATFKVVGKLNEQIYFHRTDKEREGGKAGIPYQVPISQLSAWDRFVMATLRDKSPPPPPKKVKKWTDNYIVNREKRIGEIEMQIKILETEAKGGREGIGLKRNREREVKELRAELRELESDIEVFKLNQERAKKRRGE